MGGSTSKESSSSSHTDVASVWFPDFEANQVPSLEGKIVAVTGCTSGTGLVVAKTCARKGAKAVLLLNRPSPRADAADALVKSQVVEGSTTTVVETVPCDLQDFDSVRSAAAQIKAKYEAIDVLCNNAGVMALEDVATKDGYDVQMQTNHLSHFLLTKELYPMLKRAQELRGEARVVNHSSGMRRHPNHPLQPEYLEKKGGQLGGNASGYLLNGPRWERYHQTKLANAVFTLALRDRFGESSGIKAVCAAPGAAATNLQLTAKDSGAVGEMGLLMTKYVSQSAEDGAMPILRACFDPDTNNGDFFEPSQYLASRGPAVKVEYDKLSSDVDSRTLLWEKSEEACGKFEI